MYVRSSAFDDDHQALVHDLRDRVVPGIPELRPYRVLIGGLSAGVEDYSSALYSVFPLLVAAVLALTFLILTFLFRSIVLPIKAILLNVIGILATYGTLVLIFEDGWGANLIGLEPQGKLFVITPALLFVILFGLSTDYEVFMLSRIGERFRATGDNEESVPADWTIPRESSPPPGWSSSAPSRRLVARRSSSSRSWGWVWRSAS